MRTSGHAIAFIGLCSCTSVSAQQWDPDYGIDGTLTVELPSQLEQNGFSRIVQQPSGRYVLFGEARTATSQATSRYTMVGFDATGTLEATFGTDGLAYVDPPNTDALRGPFVSMLPDGSFYLLGGSNFTSAPGVGAQNYALLMHLSADGVLDSGFGNAGYVTISLGNQFDTRPLGLSLRDDGAVNVVLRYVRDERMFYVRRYLADGTPDPAFTPTVLMPPTAADSLDHVETIRYRTLGDGAMLYAAVAFDNGLGTRSYTTLFKMDGEGELDPSFGQDGWSIDPATDCTGSRSLTTPIPVDSDGRLLVAELLGISTMDFRRYMPDGSADPSFGTAGAAPFTGTSVINTYHYDAGGNIIGSRANGIRLYSSDGAPIAAFGNNGVFSTTNSAQIHPIEDGSVLAWWSVGPDISIKRLVYDLTLGVHDEATPATINVFPNPVQDRLSVQADQPIGRVEVMGSTGQVVAVLAIAGGAVDFASFSPGCYMLRFYDGTGEVVGRARTIKVGEGPDQ